MRTFRWVAGVLPVVLGLASFPCLAAAALRSDPSADGLRSTSDWPTYRHDMQRSAATEEKLSLPLKQAWSYACPQPPAPAWPDPFHLVNRLDFDYAPSPVVAEGIVCFGSSSDDTVRALEVKTGREKWHFITGGPVRFAPQIEKGRVYFASDDGVIYCLEAVNGKLVWKFNAAPSDERLVGQHRMISRWPVRTGILVADGAVYGVAGMWPAEGIFRYALDAATGRVLWCEDSNGGTPQGPLLAGGELLLVPNANSGPTPFVRRTGKPIPWIRGGQPGAGGTWLTIDGNSRLYSYASHRSGVLMIQPYVLTNGQTGKCWGAEVVPQLSIWTKLYRTQIHAKGKVSAIVHKGQPYARHAYGIALAGTTLLLGHDGSVSAEPAASGKAGVTNAPGTGELWRAPVEGEARELAVADGRLFVATSRGVITCFEPGEGKGGGVQGSASAKATADKSGFRVQEEGKSSQRSMASDQSSVGSQNSQKSKIENLKSKIIDALASEKVDRGFALVLGDPDAQLSRTLAEQTQLRIVTVLTDTAAAQALRERLLSDTTLYGSRIHVQTVERLDRLPFAQYFANAVIVAGTSGGPGAPVRDVGPSQRDSRPRTASESGLSGKELYRVLRPCGGVLMFPGLPPTEADALVKATGAIDKELRPAADAVRVVRGKLPGALDWNTNPKEQTTDQRVKWPLRHLWFGGPATRQVQLAGEGAPGPTAGNGRYVMFSETALTAVDAYNGEVLWTRPIPRQTPQIIDVDGLLFSVSDLMPPGLGKADLLRGARLNDDFVYLQLGKAYFRGKSDAFIQLDARTGEQKKFYGFYVPPTNISLKTPQTWPVDVNTNHSGTVRLEAAEKGLVVTLTTRDPTVTPQDVWELFFDLRPPEQRYGLYERGVFNVRVAVALADKTPPSWSPGNGAVFPAVEVSGTREADGTKTVVVLPWAELQKIAGTKPSSFGFAVTLNSHDGLSAVASAKADGRDEPIVRRHLFGDWAADGVNNGWASVTVDGSVPTLQQAGTAKPPAIVAGASNTMKDPAGRAWGGRSVNKDILWAPGLHPLTGELAPKIYGEAPVCGQSYYAGHLISGHFSIYDLADNSGAHSVGGVKTGCTTPQLAALGLLIISEENGHCVCNYPFRGSLAMAPAERRLNEDWSQFYERDVDTRVRQAHLNFGAPGDRRDADGNLWLGFPRQDKLQTPDDFPNADHPLPYPQGMRDAQTGLWYRRPLRPSVWVPLTVEMLPGFGAYWISADRVPIQGTDRPWLYGSGYRGIQKAALKLDFFKPLRSLSAAVPIAVDGKLDEACWRDELLSTNCAPVLPYTETRVVFRHDDKNFYVGVQRPPVIFRPPRAVKTAGTSHGAFQVEPRAWQKGQSKPDALAAKDNVWRLIVSDAAARKSVHFSMTPDGTRAEAMSGESTNALNWAWNPAWESAAMAGTNGWTVEMAISWATLESAGLNKDQLAVNFFMTDPGIGTEALTYLGMGGQDRCSNFTPLGLGAPKPAAGRAFTVRLHFAEPDADAKPGQRVFDVKLQGQPVLKGLDIVKEAGAPSTALVKEFKGIKASDTLTLEFVSAAKEPTAANVPILNALEMTEEGFTPVKVDVPPEKTISSTAAMDNGDTADGAPSGPTKGADGKAASTKADKPKPQAKAASQTESQGEGPMSGGGWKAVGSVERVPAWCFLL
ncbi:MAG: PQQ-binding-like beta-propeller repeat protein [Lentisphaerae bacterium]|nr:PQQ-binding-like beta-propeller repeat protein [Lentisphaerota bacterium]